MNDNIFRSSRQHTCRVLAKKWVDGREYRIDLEFLDRTAALKCREIAIDKGYACSIVFAPASEAAV
jgi:hypothetical protein